MCTYSQRISPGFPRMWHVLLDAITTPETCVVSPSVEAPGQPGCTAGRHWSRGRPLWPRTVNGGQKGVTNLENQG